ncbi:MAG: TetR family transcriptional regulator [Pseudomonadota bacterium]
MTSGPLTEERIIDAAEDVLRRFGPRKTNVVDVARELGVSHGTVYRHFPSKAALGDAVVRRWLHRVSEPLEAIVAKPGPKIRRLKNWFQTLMAIKRAKVHDDPELFAAYAALADGSREVVHAHVEALVAQVGRILADETASDATIAARDQRTARAVFQATLRFHHPIHSAEWSDPAIDSDFDAVWALIEKALDAPRGSEDV